MNKEAFLEVCKGLVMNCHCQVLILEVMGEYRAYLVREVSLKNISWGFSTVKGAQDITKLVLNVGMNFYQGMTERALIQTIYEDGYVMYNDGWFIVECDEDGTLYVDVTGRAIQECPDYQNMEYVMDAACKESWQNS